MLYNKGKQVRGMGELPPMPTNPGGIFGAEYTNNVVDASVAYYEAVRLGKPTEAQIALDNWTRLRQQAGGSPFVPAVGLDAAYANQQVAVQAAKIATNNQGVVPSQAVTTVVPITPNQTVNNSSPTPKTSPTVTTHMLEGDDLFTSIKNGLTNLADKLNPMNYVSTLGSNIPSEEWISGLPNWATIAIGLGIIAAPMLLKGDGDLGMGISSRGRRRY